MSLISSSKRNDKHAPSFNLKNRMARVLWKVIHFCLIRFSPTALKGWRVFIFRLFGASVADNVNIYPNVVVWAPWNLEIERGACIANGVNIYNQGLISLGADSLVSQGAYLCASTHDHESKKFDLVVKPIIIGAHSWIAADAFVGPGVEIGEGAVLGARSAAFKSLKPWSIYSGNPAKIIRERKKKESWL